MAHSPDPQGSPSRQKPRQSRVAHYQGSSSPHRRDLLWPCYSPKRSLVKRDRCGTKQYKTANQGHEKCCTLLNTGYNWYNMNTICYHHLILILHGYWAAIKPLRRCAKGGGRCQHPLVRCELLMGPWHFGIHAIILWILWYSKESQADHMFHKARHVQSHHADSASTGVAHKKVCLCVWLPVWQCKMRVYDDMEVSINGDTPKWMVYKGNPIKMDDLGVPPFMETPTSSISLWHEHDICDFLGTEQGCANGLHLAQVVNLSAYPMCGLVSVLCILNVYKVSYKLLCIYMYIYVHT